MILSTILWITLMGGWAFGQVTVGDEILWSMSFERSDSGVVEKGATRVRVLKKWGSRYWVHKHWPPYISRYFLMPEDRIPGRDALRKVLQECEARGGIRQSLWIRNETFETCYWNYGESEVWVGEVPFGIVKRVDKHGPNGRVVYEVVGYRWASQPTKTWGLLPKP